MRKSKLQYFTVAGTLFTWMLFAIPFIQNQLVSRFIFIRKRLYRLWPVIRQLGSKFFYIQLNKSSIIGILFLCCKGVENGNPLFAQIKITRETLLNFWTKLRHTPRKKFLWFRKKFFESNKFEHCHTAKTKFLWFKRISWLFFFSLNQRNKWHT